MTETSNTPKATTDLDRLPKRLSPSRAKQFENCPKSFYFQTIEKRPTKNTVANTRGTLAHTALEELFRLPREERTIEKAHTYVEPAWDEIKEKDSYKDMVEPGSKEEADMLKYARQMVTNYFSIENPQAFDAGHIEYHAEAEIGGLELHGYIDRLDKMPIPTLDGEEKYLISDYKALTLDTLIPTPTGWTTMGDIQVGDEALGTDGAPVTVLNKSKIHLDRRCFDVVFDDAYTITADEDHLWKVQYDSGKHEAVVTTETLIDLLDEYGDVRVPATAPLWFTFDLNLPIPPRYLGVWLANGMQDDPELEDAQQAYLNRACEEKRIPQEYLRASVEQRVGLLEGLLTNLPQESDEEGHVVVHSESETLLQGLDELIFSLGGISRPGPTPTSRRLTTSTMSGPQYRELTAVFEVDNESTQCIEVDAPDSMFLAGRTMVPTHNTGKIPRDRYLDDAFFAMRIYALLVYEETGEMPFMLRLIYLKGKSQEEAVRRVIVTPELLNRTRRDVENIWRRIRTAAATNTWPTKAGPLCNFCDFKPICPAFTDKEV